MSANTDKAAVVTALSRLLAETYTLAFKTHGYHWNVVGSDFFALHKLFEEQYGELYAAADETAERIRALDAPAPSSYGAFTKLATITADDERPDAQTMLKNLSEANRIAAGAARDLIEIATANGDEGSADLGVQRVRAHDKASWMLSAHLR